MTRWWKLPAALMVMASALLSLQFGSSPGSATEPDSSLRGNGSIDEAWMTGAQPGDRITLLRDGTAVANPDNPGEADRMGSRIVRNLTPGKGYAWHDDATGQDTHTFSVLSPGANPSRDSPLYRDQRLHDGLNYVTMRDGISLAATVRFPPGTSCSAAAPCPTVVEYSGLQRGGPDGPDSILDRRGAGCCPARTAPIPTSCPTAPPTSGPWWLVYPDSPPSACRCVEPAALAGHLTSSGIRPTTTPTTPSRSSPISLGSHITGSAWWGSAIPVCRNYRRPARTHRAWRRSRR